MKKLIYHAGEVNCMKELKLLYKSMP